MPSTPHWYTLIHLPEWVDNEYLEQLTAEKAVRKYVKGRGAVKEWVKLRTRNEALDLTVYSLAALHIYSLVTGQGMNLIRSLAERAAAWAAGDICQAVGS